MTITFDHPESRRGRPVVLDDAGDPLSDRAGFKLFRKRYALSVHAMGELCGVSGRTVESWSSRYAVPLYALLVMADRLRRDATA
jgi:hypothetical protein